MVAHGVSQMGVFATSHQTNPTTSHPTPPRHTSHPHPLIAILMAERDSKKYHEIQSSEIGKVSYNKNQQITKYFTAQHTGTIYVSWGWVFATEYFKMVFLEIPLCVNKAGICLEGHVLHLNKVHPSSVLVKKDHNESATTQLSIKRFGKGKLWNGNQSCSVKMQKEITQILTKWTRKDMRPIFIVSDEGLKELLSFIVPNYRPPSITCVSSLIWKDFIF